MKYVLDVRKGAYCDDVCEKDILECIRCELSSISVKPITGISDVELKMAATESADKCRTITQNEEYHNDCSECFQEGFNFAMSKILN